MPSCTSVSKQIAALALSAMIACGCSDNLPPKQDSGPGPGRADAPMARDLAADPGVTADAPADSRPADAGDGASSPLDAAAVDAPTLEVSGIDQVPPRIDVAPQETDGAGIDGPGGEAPGQAIDATSAGVDAGAGGVDTAAAQTDAAPDGADAAFQPGPATAIAVNSGNTAEYSLGDGTWKMFFFDAEAGQLYVVSGLDVIARGYLGISPSVSPASYDMATDPISGTLYFTAPTAQRYYLAVGVNGGGASGWFQVADGGKPIPVGTTTLSLTPADAGDSYNVYRFPVAAGHGYILSLQGPAQPNVGLSVAPRPERSMVGEFSYSAWGVGGSLPFTNEEITAASVAASTSGYYYLNIRILAPITFTITIAQMP
jgi:hypothetical protein